MVEYDTHDWRSHLLDIRGSMVREIVYRVLSVVLFALAVTVIDQTVDYNLGVDIHGHSLIGTALGLLLVFRTNAAYDRFWEGRKLWGSIINESRNLGRAVATHLSHDRQLSGEIIRWGIAFAWSTMYQLRKERGLGEIANELPVDEVRRAREADHPPLAVARAIPERLVEARNRGLISEYVMVSIDQNVQLLIDYMGACERIRNTQLPFAYMVHLRRAIIAYCFTLPFALVNHFGWLTVLVVMLISYTLYGIEEIGVEIEGPFGDDENDLPLESFCQTIQRNLDGVLNTLDPEPTPRTADHCPGRSQRLILAHCGIQVVNGKPADPLYEPPEEAMPLLEEYLAELQAGGLPDRAKLLACDPGLSSMLDCLDALEHLAPPPAPAGISGSSVDAPTIDSAHPSPEDSSPERFEWSGQLVADFGRYELMGEIGRGGMGVVYKARQKDLDRIVALKMIQARHLASDAQVKRFYAEAKAAGKLQHQNIVRIHEVGQALGQHYFAMEYVAGESLADVVRQSIPDAATAAECVAVVARAVAYLHEQGIVHRDLKPSNILLDDAGRPYVTDFGLAKLLGAGDNADNGTIAGTPSYMAPEQAAGQNDQVGPLSDVYSLGAILYELLVGRPPFRASTALDTLVLVLESEPDAPRRVRPQVPPELEQICLRCLEKDPLDRYSSAVALAEDLERFLRSDAIDVRPAGWWPRLRRWARREPALVSRLIGIGICIAISQIKHMLLPGDVTLAHHVSVLIPMFVWIAASLVFQQMLNREAWAELGRFLWAGADAVLLTSVLFFTGVPPGPLMIGFPLMIAASGLWFQESLVWFMTGCSLLGYFMLALSLPTGNVALHHHVVFLVFLAVMGVVVAYQVRRVRALTSYFARRR